MLKALFKISTDGTIQKIGTKEIIDLHEMIKSTLKMNDENKYSIETKWIGNSFHIIISDETMPFTYQEFLNFMTKASRFIENDDAIKKLKEFVQECTNFNEIIDKIHVMMPEKPVSSKEKNSLLYFYLLLIYYRNHGNDLKFLNIDKKTFSIEQNIIDLKDSMFFDYFCKKMNIDRKKNNYRRKVEETLEEIRNLDEDGRKTFIKNNDNNIKSRIMKYYIEFTEYIEQEIKT